MSKDTLLADILTIKSECPANKLNKTFKEKHKEIYDEICNLTDSICTSDNPSIMERLYIIENGITDKNELLCPICNKNFRKFKCHTYDSVCSRSCHNKNNMTKKKIKATRLANHNGQYVDDLILSKTRQTCINRYGTTSYSKTQEFAQKVKTTKKLKYGSETFNNSDKMKMTKLERYGSSNYNNKEKIKKTFNERYGVNSPVQIKAVQLQQQTTCLKKYGVKSFLQTSECKDQSKKMSYEKMENNQFDFPYFSYDDYLKTVGDSVLQFKCRKCNNIFQALHHDGYHLRCPKCYPYVPSKTQLEIKEFLIQMTDVSENNRKIISPYELDFYIKKDNLAIEFDGLYWHSAELGKDKKYHLMKTESCEKHGIHLIHIFENEWLCKKDIVKSRIKNLLGIYDKTIFARKCEIRDVDNISSKAFQDANHIQGAVNAKVNLGLYYNNELISLMTFGKCRFDKKHEWELLRFCNKLGYHIPGGAGKLLKHFERNWKPKSLVSYADRRWSQGKLYDKLNFKLSHISEPNYWYWKDPNILESRIKYQKHKLKNLLDDFDENKSEVENMKCNGYFRIFDCGNLVFEKDYTYEIA